MDINDYMFLNRKVLKFVGLYPTNVARYILCCVCMFTIIIPQAMQIYQDWQDLAIVLETSSVLLTILLAVLKSLVWINNRKKMDPFIDYMLTDYWKIMTAQVSKHADIYATYARKLTKGYIFLICNPLLFFFSLPLVEIFISVISGSNSNSTKHFPFVALYPNFCYDFPLYEIIYLSQIIATSLCGLIILGTDTLIATALFHTCAHFRILQEKIENVDNKDNVQVQLAYSEKNIVQRIKLQMIHIIKHHYTILRFCDYMEMLFSPMLFLQTLASSLIICLVGLQVTNESTEKYKLIRYLSYLVMALFQLLLFCIPGDDLINQSFTVSKTLYAINWYEIPVSFKIEICLLMLRSQKPSKITAGKFYVMHLENFNSVLNTAASYFMLLRSVNSEENNVN